MSSDRCLCGHTRLEHRDPGVVYLYPLQHCNGLLSCVLCVCQEWWPGVVGNQPKEQG